MMRRALVVCFALFIVQPASADTRIYVSGDLFAEITRLSRTITDESPVIADIGDPGDSVTIGGGGRIGAFFAPAWSLEVGLDSRRRSAKTDAFASPTDRLSFQRFAQYQRERGIASAHRLCCSGITRRRADESRRLRGGVSFMHVERSLTREHLDRDVYVASGHPAGVARVVVRREVTFITNGLSGTVAPKRRSASKGLAVVPEVRVLAGGLGGILIRPGVAARWRWYS
jgi:hypothetical protein